VTERKLAIFTNVGVQTDNTHIVDFSPLLKSIPCLGGIVSTPVEGILNINGGFLLIGVRTELILRAWIFAVVI
jgi:hypothetical protein